jgi:hypothetical protein
VLAELVLGVEAARTRLYAGACSRRYSGFAALRANDAAEAYVEMDGWQLVRAADGTTRQADATHPAPHHDGRLTRRRTLRERPRKRWGCGHGP